MVETADGTSSDDEVYDAVDLISDSEDDESTVEHDEEQNIISSEEEVDTLPVGDSTQRRGSLDEDDNSRVDDEDGSEDLKANLQGSWVPARVQPSDAECAYMNPYFANEMEMFNAANICERTQPMAFPETKHVHFQDDNIFDSDGSCSVTSSDDENGHLDPFMCQDQLDPDFRSLIENDEDDDDGDEDQDDEDEEIQTTLRFECDEKNPLEGSASESESRPSLLIIFLLLCSSLAYPWISIVSWRRRHDRRRPTSTTIYCPHPICFASFIHVLDRHRRWISPQHPATPASWIQATSPRALDGLLGSRSQQAYRRRR